GRESRPVGFDSHTPPPISFTRESVCEYQVSVRLLPLFNFPHRLQSLFAINEQLTGAEFDRPRAGWTGRACKGRADRRRDPRRAEWTADRNPASLVNFDLRRIGETDDANPFPYRAAWRLRDHATRRDVQPTSPKAKNRRTTTKSRRQMAQELR